ncbi:mammaglobin-A-like [Molossus nigricans]
MKLLAVLMLTALPLYCSADFDCKLFNGAYKKTFDAKVTPAEFTEYLRPFISDAETEMGLREVKQCILNQNADIIAKLMMGEELILNSPFCDEY